MIGIDVRLDEARAARLRRAFDDWFSAVENDKRARREAVQRHGSHEVLRSKELFGPEAEGGYLIRMYNGERGWMLLVPDAPVTKRQWA